MRPIYYRIIRVITDREKIAGQFVISGSQNLLLKAGIAQSLAGRVAIFNLLPFSLVEIQNTPFARPTYEDYILRSYLKMVS